MPTDPCPTCGHVTPFRVPDLCISCQKELTRVFEEHANRQYDNALEITLSGGYGMFFDNIDGDHHAFLCHDCAHTACNTLPWLRVLIRPERSHSHRAEYWAANPDHEGWDKKT